MSFIKNEAKNSLILSKELDIDANIKYGLCSYNMQVHLLGVDLVVNIEDMFRLITKNSMKHFTKK